MRVHISNWMRKLAFTLLLVPINLLPSHAHDLPTTSLSTNALQQDCLGIDAPTVSIATEASLKYSPSYDQPKTHRFGRQTEFVSSSSWAAFQVCSAFVRQALAPTWDIRGVYASISKEHVATGKKTTCESYSCHLPDAGRPPSPLTTSDSSTRLAMRAHAKGRQSEDYMSYDWSIRDWRFRQFSYLNKSRERSLPLIALKPVEKPAAKTDQLTYRGKSDNCEPRLSLASLLSHVEDFQCIGYQFLASDNEIERLSYELTLRWNSLQQGAAESLVASLNHNVPETTERQPLFREPQYVVHSLGHGKRLVLTQEQSLAWGVTRWSIPESAPKSVASSSECPIIRLPLSHLSRHLAQVGNSLLSVSKYLDTLTLTRVASVESTPMQ